MKLLALLSLLLLPLAAFADDASMKPLVPSNVQIIDGKKFFSLANVRHHEGSGLSPSAIAVMNNPRQDYRVPVARRLAMTPTGAQPPKPYDNIPLPWAKTEEPALPNIASPKMDLPPASPPVGGAAAQKAELLSIFAPDDHISASPSAK